MGIPSTGERSDAQCYFLREVTERYKDKVELVYPKQCVFRSFHDFARNAYVEEFLESDCDVLWFLDSDICPPKHVLDLVALHWNKWEAAGACYPIFMVPPGGSEPSILFTAYKGVIEGQGIGLTSVPKSGQEFVDGLATGCLFLKRELFAKLEKPYFEFKFNEETRQMKEGEDLGFCLKVNKLGVKFFTDYSMVCKHYKRVCLLDINNYAIDMSNAKVLEYDAEIRPKVEKFMNTIAEQQQQQKKEQKLPPGLNRSKSGLILPKY